LRFPLMALAALSLLAALWGGLARLGWDLPPAAGSLKENHGPLMVIGFLGTLIPLERAVALRRVWPYGAPLFAALSSLSLLIGLPLPLSQILAALAGLVLVAIFVFLCWRQPADFLLTMGTGAFLWLAGVALWFRADSLHEVVPWWVGFLVLALWFRADSLHEVVPWWVGFLVLTIAGERLELSRLMTLSRFSRATFFAAVGLFLFGLGMSLFAFAPGLGVSAAALEMLGLWLLRWDIAWRTVRQSGLPRFMAISLLSGYIWLGLAGSLWLVLGDFFVAGPRYDAMLHSVFLGFVFSMIFAHAPIIFPSITGIAMPFYRFFYLHLALLHGSLLLRVAGDLLLWTAGQKWGGLLNVVAIVLFLANNGFSIYKGRATDRPFSHL
ncbi:MAG: hypothetical protein HYS67_08935, partial [Deltaproteobacteria bacterium]|nr:hypothetical protein [Deltaproteobacteria bacterium]